MRKLKSLLLAACFIVALAASALAEDGIIHTGADRNGIINTGGDKTPPPPPAAATTASSESSGNLLDESLLTILQALLPRV